jgi:predicted ATPase/DNA-binding CsgD family transcriptional regulator
LIEIFAGELWVVDFATVTESDEVVRAVAAAVGIGERPGQPLAETLVEVLRNRAALLVLDNCEHVVTAGAELAAALLHGCLELKILATSREPLGITGEIAWPMPPLKEAMRLFTERAQAVRPSFALTENTAPVVSQIAHQLDGLPLALELAAARVRVLTVDEIADRLGDALSLLIGDRTTVARHRSLQATFDWSHALLSRAEQLLFRRLSIFRGGFTLDAVEVICTGDGLDRRRVLDVLTQLVDRSLVIADEIAGGTRYRLLEVVRQYADERRLEADTADGDLAARHVAYYLGFAEEAERGSTGPDEPIWFDRLAREHDNLRAALRSLIERPSEGPEAARLAAALWEFWFIRGFSTEGIGWLQAAATRAGAGGGAAKAKALHGLVVLGVFQEDYELAKTSGEECLTLYRELDDVDGVAAALTALSTAAAAGQREDIPVSHLLAEARSLVPQLQDQRVLGNLRYIEGMLTLSKGDAVQAAECWREALTLHRTQSNLLGVAFILASLGLLAARLGDAAAEGRLVEGLQLSRDLDYKLVIHHCLIGLGALAAGAGRLSRGARLWGAADAMTEAYGTHLTQAARALLDYEGRIATARERLDDSSWCVAWAEGRRMTADQAIAYALDEPAAQVSPVDGHPAGLTDREVDVLRLVAQGLTSADVGRRLFLSSRTVEWHLSSIYTKVDARSRTEAARFAVDHGLV